MGSSTFSAVWPTTKYQEVSINIDDEVALIITDEQAQCSAVCGLEPDGRTTCANAM